MIREDGSITETDQDKAETLNNFFSSVFTTEDKSNIPNFPTKTDKTITDINITTDEIKKALSSLNCTKSPGPDNIHPKILKELASELALPLKILFDKTLKTGKLPSSWKLAEVRPIFKKGDKSKPGNYRPVSLTSIICKVFESFIKKLF